MIPAIVIAAIVSAPFIVVLAVRPTSRRLAVRNAIRRPRESALVILGSLLATALITAAFVVGDTFNSSIRSFAFTQLGPVDEVVTVVGESELPALRERLSGFEHPDIDGTLELTTVGVAAATLDGDRARTAAPKAQLLEVDFAAARDFGGDAGATGISGATPAPGRAVIVADLARKLDIAAGDSFTVYGAGTSLTLSVDRVVPQRGVAGWWLGDGQRSYNAFVAPGTISEFAVSSTSEAVPPAYSIVVSNRGGIESGVEQSDSVTRALEARLEGVQAEVNPLKQELFEDAGRNGESLTQLYSGISAFAVLAGILLMVNIFSMLAHERRSELGMLRAMGMRRKSLIMGFASEGWLYAVIASAVGIFAGLGIARVILVGAAKIFSGSDDAFSLTLQFSAKPRSLGLGFAIGLVIAMATVVGTSIGTAFFNVIAAIRGIENERESRRRTLRIVVGSLISGLGGVVLLWGLSAPAATRIIVGLPIAVWGGYIVFRAIQGARRSAVTIAAIGVLVWSVLAVTIAVARDAELNIDAFVSQGVTGVIAAVALCSEYQNEIGRFVARITRGSLTVRIGLAYPLAKRNRTAFTIGQFALVMFILVYISVLSHMFSGQVDGFTRDVSGDYNALVKWNAGNPIDVDELAARPGVTSAAPLTQAIARITPKGEAEPHDWFMSSIDSRFIDGGAPKLEALGDFDNDEAAYQALLADPNAVMVDSFFLSDNGPPSAAVSIGDTITVTDPVSGRSKELTVIAESADDMLFNGGLMNPDAMREIFGARAVPNRAYLTADDPEALAASLEADYFDRGAEADSIRNLVDTQVQQQNQFFGLMRSFLAVGLIIGIAGIGVIMVRAVRERRRQIGILRSLGFAADSVSSSFAVEAGFLAIEGTLIGVLLGFVCTWSITKSDDFGEGFQWGVPWVAILVLVAITLIGSLLATLGPARSAAKIRPSVALRITD
jgi:putative ABC transport system permease protein